jgi:hypothetical protein
MNDVIYSICLKIATDVSILLAKSGPIFEKYSLKPSAISWGSK